MQDIELIITTYNRKDKLLALLSDIDRYSEGYRVKVKVYDDGSTEDYQPVLYKSKKIQVEYFKFKVNNGKHGYWKVIQKAFQVQKSEADYYFMLPDDVRLEEDFFTKSIDAWNRIDDRYKICLSLLMDEGRVGKPNWTNITPRKEFGVWRTQWNDLCFLSQKKFFEALGFMIRPIYSARWKNNKMLSSGVGEQISLRLYKSWSMYHVPETLVFHGQGESKMNEKIRKVQPMLTKERVTVGLATIPERQSSLYDTVTSILPQCDTLNVFLNGFEDVPAFLQNKKIQVFRSQDSKDMGDAGKFFKCQTKGYYLAIDDDIVYPRDYVSKMITKIEEYDRKCCVSLHGGLLIEPITSYYKSRKQYHCLRTVAEDKFVHVLGTGVLAYHTSTIKVRWEDFQKENMADIWFARLAQAQKIPQVVVEHSEGWITLNPKVNVKETIFWKQHNNAHFQTEVCNEIKWKCNILT